MKTNTLVSMAVLAASFQMSGCTHLQRPVDGGKTQSNRAFLVRSFAGPHAGVLGRRSDPGGNGNYVNQSRIKVLTDSEGIAQNVVWKLDEDPFNGEEAAIRPSTSNPPKNPRYVTPGKYTLRYRSATNSNVTFTPPSPQEITLGSGEFYKVFVDFD